MNIWGYSSYRANSHIRSEKYSTVEKPKNTQKAAYINMNIMIIRRLLRQAALNDSPMDAVAGSLVIAAWLFKEVFLLMPQSRIFM